MESYCVCWLVISDWSVSAQCSQTIFYYTLLTFTAAGIFIEYMLLTNPQTVKKEGGHKVRENKTRHKKDIPERLIGAEAD